MNETELQIHPFPIPPQDSLKLFSSFCKPKRLIEFERSKTILFSDKTHVLEDHPKEFCSNLGPTKQK